MVYYILYYFPVLLVPASRGILRTLSLLMMRNLVVTRGDHLRLSPPVLALYDCCNCTVRNSVVDRHGLCDQMSLNM